MPSVSYTFSSTYLIKYCGIQFHFKFWLQASYFYLKQWKNNLSESLWEVIISKTYILPWFITSHIVFHLWWNSDWWKPGETSDILHNRGRGLYLVITTGNVREDKMTIVLLLTLTLVQMASSQRMLSLRRGEGTYNPKSAWMFVDSRRRVLPDIDGKSFVVKTVTTWGSTLI